MRPTACRPFLALCAIALLCMRALADTAWQQPDPVLTLRAMHVVQAHPQLAVGRLTGPQQVLQMLLADRSFAGAAVWQRRFPDLRDVIVPVAARLGGLPGNVYVIGADEVSLLEVRRERAARDGLVVVGHPSCAFTRQAAEWMRAQGTGAFMQSLWLAPAGGNLMLDRLSSWNAQQPGQAFVLARSDADWPFIARWDSPQFFWMEGGQVREHSTGWTEASQALLRRYLDR